MGTYAIMRMEKRKIGTVGRIEAHHERTKEAYKSNPDIDPGRTHLNYHLARSKCSYRNNILEHIQRVGAKRRKDSVVMQDCLVTATPEWLKGLSAEEQSAYLNHAYAFFCEKVGEENIVSAVVHLDEATPHLHLCFIPLTKDGRLSSKEVVGGPKGLVKWQDDFYKHMSQRYPSLDRGIPARVTHRKHIPVFMFKAADELYKHYEEIQSAINSIGLIGNARKKDEAIALIGRYAPEMSQLAVQLKTTEKYIANLEHELGQEKSLVSRLQGDKSYLNETLWQQEKELLKKEADIRNLQRKQEHLQKLVEKIPPELLKELTKEERQRRSRGMSR